MTRTAKTLSASIVLLVLILLGLAVYLRFRKSPDFPQTIHLPDGSQLTLIGATYGTNHLSPGFLPTRIYESLPKGLRDSIGIPSRLKLSSPETTLCLWLRKQNEPAGTPTQLSYSFLDHSGFESMVYARTSMLGSAGESDLLEGIMFDVFPRESVIIRLRLTDRYIDSGPKTLGEFHFSNPNLVNSPPSPTWKAGSRTIRSPSGVFEATLLKCVVGRDSEMEEPYPSSFGYGSLVTGLATFVFNSGGQAATNWTVKSIEMSDPFGNQISKPTWNHWTKNRELLVRFGPVLWPSDSPWKMRVEFHRLPGAEFTPSELVTFKNVPIPGTNAAIPGAWATNLQGATLVLKGLTGANGRLTNATAHFRTVDSMIVAGLYPWTNGSTVSIIRRTSNLGQELRTQFSGGSGGEFLFAANSPTNASTQDITFAVHQSQFLEFMVKPELVGTNRAEAKTK